MDFPQICLNTLLPSEEGLKSTYHLDPDSIRQVLFKAANQIELLISKEIAMICLKMDAATRMDRDFLGVNIQFRDKKLIKIRTLNIIELHDRHTAENLTEEVLKTLEPFGIDVRRLLTVTTDNASNMRATINRLELNCTAFVIEEEDNEDEERDQLIDHNLVTWYFIICRKYCSCSHSDQYE